MKNTIEIVKDYKKIIEIKNKLHQNFCTLKPFLITMVFGILSIIFCYSIYDGPYANISTVESLSIMIPVLFAIFSFQYCFLFLHDAITQNFAAFVLSYRNYCKKYLSDEEKQFLENIFDDSFKNIIKQNKKELVNKLNRIEFDIAENIFTKKKRL